MFIAGAYRKISSVLGLGRVPEDIIPVLEERSFIQRCLRTTLSSPCIEMIGVCSGMVTAWYLWKSDGRGKPDGNAAADGGCRRVALSERVARGVPLLVATGLWQSLIQYGGQQSRLDPLICVLSWILLEMIMTYVPLAAWDAIDIRPPKAARTLVLRREARTYRNGAVWNGRSEIPAALAPSTHAERQQTRSDRRRVWDNRFGTSWVGDEEPVKLVQSEDYRRASGDGRGSGGQGERRGHIEKQRSGGSGGGVWKSERSTASNSSNSNSGSNSRDRINRRRSTGPASEIGTGVGMGFHTTARQVSYFRHYQHMEPVASPGPVSKSDGEHENHEHPSTSSWNGYEAVYGENGPRDNAGATDRTTQGSTASSGTGYRSTGVANPHSIAAAATGDAGRCAFTPSPASRPAALRPMSFTVAGEMSSAPMASAVAVTSDCDDGHIPPPPPPPPLSMRRAAAAEARTPGSAVRGTPGSVVSRTPDSGLSRTPGSGVRRTPGDRFRLNRVSSMGAVPARITETDNRASGGGGAAASSRRNSSSRRWLRRLRAASASSIAYSDKQRFDSLRSAKGDESSWAAAVSGVITKRPRSSGMQSFSSPATKKGLPAQVYDEIFAGTDMEECGERRSSSTSASGGDGVGHSNDEDTGAAFPSNSAVMNEEGTVKEAVGGRGVGDPLFGSGEGDKDGDVEGTPVPVEFRPVGRERDVLCTWRLDHLRKDEDVGMFAQGTFGKVVAARTETGRQLAVKIMEKSELSPERYIDRELDLLRECSVHPHVVGLLGVIKTTSKVYVLMPLADSDVAAMIKCSTRLNETQASYVVRQVISAVEFLHERSIVHRDIKPANLLVLSNKLLLADFGLAKKMAVGQDAITGACGTKPYLAPELVRDLPYDQTVDLWAIGVVTYELLHGHTPFRPTLTRARSWDGLMPEPQHESDGTAAAIHGGRTGDSHGLSSGSVSESSGSIVGDRMFERSAPAAPGAGLDRAWLAGRAAHQALVYGKGIAGGNGHGNGDDGDVGGGWLGDVAGAGRRGYRAADQMRLLDNIARGRYTADEVLVGEQGRSFISQLLQQCPARRISAASAAEHPWISGGSPAKVPPRRRAARVEVACISAQRAAEEAERYAAHARAIQRQLQRQLENAEKRLEAAMAANGGLAGVDTEVKKVNLISDDVYSTAATVTILTEIANLAAMMALEANAAREDAKRWEKSVTAATALTAGPDRSASGGLDDRVAAEAAAKKAEAAVGRAEALAQEAEAGSTAAAGAFEAWRESRSATAAAAAADAGVPATATTVPRKGDKVT